MDRQPPDAPPERRRIPEAWYRTAVTFAHDRPGHAASFAGVLESLFNDPFDPVLRQEIAELAAWMRSRDAIFASPAPREMREGRGS